MLNRLEQEEESQKMVSRNPLPQGIRPRKKTYKLSSPSAALCNNALHSWDTTGIRRSGGNMAWPIRGGGGAGRANPASQQKGHQAEQNPTQCSPESWHPGKATCHNNNGEK